MDVKEKISSMFATLIYELWALTEYDKENLCRNTSEENHKLAKELYELVSIELEKEIK